MAVVFKTLSTTLAANVNEVTFTDTIINSNSVIEIYYNSNDVYTVETWQDGTTIGIVTSDHNFSVGVKVTINNVISFEPYDDTDLVNRIGEDETAISGLADRVGTAEGDIDSLENAVGSLETALASKQDTLIAGDNITIEDNVISSTGGSSGIDYSTTEQIIGTWIDGKPLYCIVLPEISVSSGDVTYTHNLGIKYYINYYGICTVNNDTSHYLPFPFYQHQWSTYFEIRSFDSDTISLSASWNNNKAIPVLIYTKLSDYE